MSEMTQTATPKKKKELTFGKLIAWSLRGGSTGVALMIMGYLSMFAIKVLGIPAVTVGTLMLASKFLDGVTDIFAGYIVDKTNTKIGRGRPYELCVIGLWITTLALFICPASWGTTLKCVWLFIMYAFSNSVFMTFLNANQTVYMVRAFSDQKDYVALSTYGGLIPMVVVVIFNIIFPVLIGRIATSQAGWITLILIFAVPMVVLGLLRFFVVKETRKIDEKSGGKLSMKDVFTVLKKNPYIYIIALATFTMNLITNMGVNNFYFTDIVGNIGLLGALSAVQMIAIPMMLVIPTILKRTTVVKIIRVGILCTMAGYVLYGGGAVPISMLTGLMIIDCAEYNEYKGLYRLEGSLGAINGFAQKLGAGLGAGLLGILLGLAGYSETAAVQTAGALNMVRLLFSLIPAALYLLVYLAFHLYKLDKRMPEIRKANEEKRAKAAEEAALEEEKMEE